MNLLDTSELNFKGKVSPGSWSNFRLQNWKMANNKRHCKIQFEFVICLDFQHFMSILFWDNGWNTDIQSKIEKNFRAILKSYLKILFNTSSKYLVQNPRSYLIIFFVKRIRWKQVFLLNVTYWFKEVRIWSKSDWHNLIQRPIMSILQKPTKSENIFVIFDL